MRAPLLALVILGCAPALAAAQATVQVRLNDSAGRPVDGTVQLTGQRGSPTCRTTAGRCTMRNVTAGDYQVTATPMRETGPPPHTVRVPATGTIVVSIATRPGAAPTPVVPAPVATPRATPVARDGLQGRNATHTVAQVTNHNAVNSPPVTNMQVAEALPGRDLTTGANTRIRGTIVDGEGRPADATLIVRQGTRAIGHARSTAGRFTLRDLPQGAYTIEARSVRNGRTVQIPITVTAAVARASIVLR